MQHSNNLDCFATDTIKDQMLLERRCKRDPTDALKLRSPKSTRAADIRLVGDQQDHLPYCSRIASGEIRSFAIPIEVDRLLLVLRCEFVNNNTLQFIFSDASFADPGPVDGVSPNILRWLRPVSRF